MSIIPIQTSRTGIRQELGTTNGERRGTLTLGTNAVASGTTTLAMGANTVASGTNALAAGPAASATNTGSTAIGQGASATGLSTTVLGRTASATNDYSTALGYGCAITGSYSVAIGQGASSNGAFAIAIGRTAASDSDSSIAIGQGATTSGIYSSAVGRNAATTRYGQHSLSNGSFSANGDAQRNRYVLRRQTTDATGTEITSDGSTSGYITIAASRTMTAIIQLVAHRTDVSGTAACWPLIECGITRDATGNCRLLGTVAGDGTTTFCDAGAATWSVAVTADTTNNRLAITVTGESGKTIRWVATATMAEVG